MEGLRRPLFWIAAALTCVVVLIDLGSGQLLGKVQATAAQLDAVVDQNVPADGDVDRDALRQEVRRINARAEPPGIGIKYLALVDGLVLFSMVLMGLALLIPERIEGRLQVVLTFVVGLITVIGGFLMALVAFELLMMMLGMFLAAPFGTIAYLALFGFFDRGGAAATLGLVMTLKLATGACLLFAHPRFLQNKGLVTLFVLALGCGVLLSFLHGFVPGILVSIADALGALITAILALVWGLFMLIFSIVALIKAIV